MSSNEIKDARPPPSAEATILQLAKSYAQKAVALDTGKQYGAAAAKYTRASEVLLDLGQFTRNPKMKQLCAQKIMEYVSRAKYLASKTSLPPVPASQGSPG